ncbi:hypothetical protein [Marinobacterium stanieri]|uniref:hypothetical protein n=1 Tax=Marinobacterium stanieri TaxID=49186 RepID=UPI003A9302A6
MLSQNKAVGGYFELELPYGNEHYYPSALKYQSARSAFYALLLHYKPKKVWMPFYICDSMLVPLNEANVTVSFYGIYSDFSIRDEIQLNDGELLLYVNYFGICGNIEDMLMEKFDPLKLIFDHSQAFFSQPKECLATIYSPRKFFGVPDGGFLVTRLPIDQPSKIDEESINRCSHLLKRLAGDPENGYGDYKTAEESLKEIEPKGMSLLTSRILCAVDYSSVKKKREDNFISLHEELKNKNKLEIDPGDIAGPLIYPLWLDGGRDIKSLLKKERLFIATYWLDCLKRVSNRSFESLLVSDLIPLPCDQRYSFSKMKEIISEVLNVYRR